MISEGDHVYYAQLEMFDTELVGKEGIVLLTLHHVPETHPAEALVRFNELGDHLVRMHCLEKIK